MAKFLGSGGVQYLWTKAKETFYENGNDITLKNGKRISVLAGDGTSTSNETVITSDGVTVGAVKNDMSDPYIGYKNVMDKDGLHIYGVDLDGNQDANERVDITSSGVTYSGINGRTLKIGFEGIDFPRLIIDGNPGESKSVKVDFDDVIVQNESTTHKLSEKADKAYVDSLKPVTFTVSVPTTGWSTLTDSNGETYYKLTIAAADAISTGYPVCDVVLPDDIAAARLQENAYKCINKVSVGSENVTLYCFEEIPSVAFTIRIQIARS